MVDEVARGYLIRILLFIGLLLFIVGFFFGKGIQKMQQPQDPLGWTKTELYKTVEQYKEQETMYIENVHDCDNIHSELMYLLKQKGYDAKVIVMEVKGEEAKHAMIEVPIRINYGEIYPLDGEQYTYDYTMNITTNLDRVT